MLSDDVTEAMLGRQFTKYELDLRREANALRSRVEDLELLCESWAKSEEEGNPWGIRVTDGKVVLCVDDSDDIILDKDERTGLPLLNDAARRLLGSERGGEQPK